MKQRKAVGKDTLRNWTKYMKKNDLVITRVLNFPNSPSVIEMQKEL